MRNSELSYIIPSPISYIQPIMLMMVVHCGWVLSPEGLELDSSHVPYLAGI